MDSRRVRRSTVRIRCSGSLGRDVWSGIYTNLLRRRNHHFSSLHIHPIACPPQAGHCSTSQPGMMIASRQGMRPPSLVKIVKGSRPSSHSYGIGSYDLPSTLTSTRSQVVAPCDPSILTFTIFTFGHGWQSPKSGGNWAVIRPDGHGTGLAEQGINGRTQHNIAHAVQFGPARHVLDRVCA